MLSIDNRMSSNANNVVLSEFVGNKEINGEKRKYWIQVPSEDYHEEIIKHMIYGFSRDEPISKYAGMVNCEESVAFMTEFYGKSLKQNMALVCFTSGRDGKPTIAGLNMTIVVKKDTPKFEVRGKVFSKSYGIIKYMEGMKDPFSMLGYDTCLYALGLFVLPDFRGEGIGLALLKAREPLSRMHGIRFTCTFFSSIISQKLAARAGFKDLVSVPYTEIFEKRPEWTIPGILEHTKICKVMYLEYK